jgi:hypothetical protein
LIQLAAPALLAKPLKKELSMNRRDFLKSLLAMGASFTLPALGTDQPITATPALLDALDAHAIDEIWRKGLYLFDVNEEGTLSVAGFAEPQTRADAYATDAIELEDIDTLQKFAERTSLGNRLQDCYTGYRDGLVDELEEASTAALRRTLKKRLAKLPDDPDTGWMTWLEVEPEKAQAEFADIVADYLDEPPDWGNEFDWMPDSATAQGEAYRYFSTTDQDQLETLGVIIVEGDCPGSSYIAAELQVTVEEANRAAQAADIPIRFKAA